MSASQDLTWLLIRNYNSKLVKREKAVFSRESGNLTNQHSFKFSGLANDNTVGIDLNKDEAGNIVKGCVLSIKSRKKRRRNQPKDMHHRQVLKRDFRRVARTINNETNKQYYRRDLNATALARWTKISNCSLE